MTDSKEQKGWHSEPMTCLNCGHEWVAVYEQGEKFLECSQCGFKSPAPGVTAEPLHLIISLIGEDMYIRPSRKVERHLLSGLVADALYMLQSAEQKYVDPDDCQINLMVMYSIPDENS